MLKKIGIIVLSLSTLFGQTASAQRVLIHPEKVEIKPPTVYRTDDALKVWGGISAGPNADDIIVFEDGTLNTSAAIADGSILFVKWASNGCTSGQIPKYNGSAWACGADSTGTGGSLSLDDGSEGTPSLNFTSDTNTGMWRVGNDTIGWSVGGDRKLTLDSAGRLGIGQDSPAAQLHISASSAQSAIRLNGGSNNWDLISLNSSDMFTIGDVDSGTPTLQLDADQVAINGAPGSYSFEVNGTANITGTIGFGNVRNSVVPNSGSLNLGSISSPWSTLYANQITNVLFVEEVAQLFGGYQVVGKAVGSIASNVAPADTTIDFGETITPPQWVLIRAKDLSNTAKTEYVRVVSLSSGTTYNVERDKTSLHGATPPNWGAGTPWLLLGGQGDGRIELYANSGIPRISFFTNELAASSGSNDPSDQLEWIRIGDLSNIQTTGTTPTSTYNGKVGFYAGSGSNYIAFSVNPSGSGAALAIGGDGSGLTSINGGNIQTGTVTATQLAADSVTSAKIVAGTIAASDIAANAITSAKLEATLVLATTLQAGNVILDTNGVTANLSTIEATSRAYIFGNLTNGGRVGLFASESGSSRELHLLNALNTADTSDTSAVRIQAEWSDGSAGAEIVLTDVNTTETIAMSADTYTLTGIGTGDMTISGFANVTISALASSGDVNILASDDIVLTPTDDVEFGGDDLIPTSGRANAASLGSTTRKWNTAYLDLDAATSSFVAVATKSDGALYYVAGYDGCLAGKTIIGGIVTSTSC